MGGAGVLDIKESLSRGPSGGRESIHWTIQVHHYLSVHHDRFADYITAQRAGNNDHILNAENSELKKVLGHQRSEACR